MVRPLQLAAVKMIRLTGLLVLGSLAASSSARADGPAPDAASLHSVVRDHDGDEPATRFYVGTAVSFSGIADTGLFGSVSIESGQHLLGSLWAHEQLSIGEGGEIFGPDASVTGARAGLAFRTCTDSGIACLEGGVDLALAHYEWSSTMMQFSHERPTDAVYAVPRLAAELGIRNVHLRPSIGMPVGATLGVELGLGFAVGW